MTRYEKNDTRQSLSSDEVLSIERIRVPQSAPLQDSIIAETRGMPQSTPRYKTAKDQRRHYWTSSILSGSRPRSYAVSLIAVMILSAFLWLSTPVSQQSDEGLVATSEVIEQNSQQNGFMTLNHDQLTDELVWQDLMLMEDELAFASL